MREKDTKVMFMRIFFIQFVHNLFLFVDILYSHLQTNDFFTKHFRFGNLRYFWKKVSKVTNKFKNKFFCIILQFFYWTFMSYSYFFLYQGLLYIQNDFLPMEVTKVRPKKDKIVLLHHSIWDNDFSQIR